MAKIDHSACTHPRTPAGRRACRALHNQHVDGLAMSEMIHRPAPEVVPEGHVVIPGLGVTVPNRRRQRSSDAARIQPRKAGARVSAKNSTCIQAALHTPKNGGRCACGWSA